MTEYKLLKNEAMINKQKTDYLIDLYRKKSIEKQAKIDEWKKRIDLLYTSKKKITNLAEKNKIQITINELWKQINSYKSQVNYLNGKRDGIIEATM